MEDNLRKTEMTSNVYSYKNGQDKKQQTDCPKEKNKC
jgi:hypothetical protein